MKKILIGLFIIPFSLFAGGLIKYNIDLNNFIAQTLSDHQKSKDTLDLNRTEVHIVGTVHFETDKIKKDDFYQYLESISPAVILYEGDSCSVKRIVKKTDYFSQLIDVFKNRKRIEKPIVLKYLSRNPVSVLLPYEWELRDQYHRKHQLRKNSKEMINAVIGLYREKKLNKEQAAIIEKFLVFNNALTKIEQNVTLANINSVATDSIIKQRQYYVYKKIPEIAKEKKELSKYFDYVPVHMSYWDLRNKAMVQNILKQIQLNPNKVIVVLNGFYHRYYLIEELKKYELEFGFLIVDKP